jgi:hypothetical protein
MWGEVYEPLVDAQWPHNPISVENSMNDHFQKYKRVTPTDLWPRNELHQKSKNVIYGKETYVSEVYEPLADDQQPHNPHFCWK